MSAPSPTLRERLREATLLRGLPEEDLDRLAGIARIRSYAPGEAVFQEGDPAHDLPILLSGQVRIYKTGPDGREQTLRLVHRGEAFGEAAALLGQPYPASAEATAPARVLVLDAAGFRGLLAGNPQLAIRMIATLSRLLHDFTALVEQLTLREVAPRLAAWLLAEARRQQARGGGTVVTLTISKGLLASRLGTVPETLSRALARMRQAGLIEVKGRTIRILDAPGLEAMAEGQAGA